MMSAINRCREKGFADENITIDVLDIYKFGGRDKYPTANLTSGIDNMKRWWNIYSKNYDSRDIFEDMWAFPKVNFRYYLHNTHNCHLDMLDFNG